MIDAGQATKGGASEKRAPISKRDQAMKPIPNNVVAFTGDNLNDILAVQSARFMELLRPFGYVGHVLDLRAPDTSQRLTELVIEGIAFAWGYAGVGARLGSGNQNFWASIKVPFVSVLADPPFWMARNHQVPSNWVVNGYVYKDWLNFQKKYIRSPQISSLLPMGVLPNPDRASIPWERRPVAMAYVKTGSDPKKLMAAWERLPARLNKALREAAAILTDQPTGDLVTVATATFRAVGLHIEENRAMLFGMLNEVDLYIRAVRATRVARALLPLPVEIYGGGWEYLCQEIEGARAVFRPAFHASELDLLFARSRWLVNSTPNFSTGAHERVLRGFAAGCAVASDLNDYARSNLSHLPAFCGFEWNGPGLTDQIAEALACKSLNQSALDQGTQFVEQHFSPLAFMRSVAELADAARANEAFAEFSPEAAQ
jgi:hypothetical protein